MKKYQSLLRRVMMEAGVAALVVSGCAGTMIVASGMYESKVQEETALQGEISVAQAEVAQVQEKLNNADLSYKKYDQLRTWRRTMSMVLDRTELTDALARLKERYRLSSLNLQLLPDAPLETEKLQASGIQALQSGIQLTFGGISDEHLLSFADELLRSVPGFVRVTDLTLSREKAFTLEAMREVSRGGKPEMVTAKLDMKWFGFVSEAR